VIGTWAHSGAWRMEEAPAGLGGTAAERAAAFTRLLDGCADRSVRLATFILGNRPDAEDALNDAALRAWQSLGSLRQPERFEAWFTRILVNTCRDRLRRHRPSALVLAEAADRADPFSASVERAALRQAIGALSPDHRAVIGLRYGGDLTVEAIAERLGVPAGTVKSRLHYALAELRAAYDAAERDPRGDER
jgi:RNA polymerase sigma-70 factor (ECF subfamily)